MHTFWIDALPVGPLEQTIMEVFESAYKINYKITVSIDHPISLVEHE